MLLGDTPAIRLCIMAAASLNIESLTRPALLLEAQKGNRESLAKLILPYAAGLYRGALRFTRNPADAEDARQDALLKVVRGLEQFTGTGKKHEKGDDLHAWVSRIGANASIDIIRRRREGRFLSLEEPTGVGEETVGSGIAASIYTPEESFARLEMRKRVADAIKRLSPELRRVCLLRDVLGYSTQEVAERVGASSLTVRLRLFRARRRLRDELHRALQSPRPCPGRAMTTPSEPRFAGYRTEENSERRFPFRALPEWASGD
ncbi:MAG TPA: RNA polymerase sigma factor [Candidatus Acidoferrum sp.]